MGWKRNKIEKVYKYEKKIAKRGVIIGSTIPILIIIFLLFHGLSYKGLFIGIVITGIGILTVWKILEISREKNPQLIKLNDKGINIKDFRGKERIIPWEKIRTIYSLDDIYSSSRLGPSDVTGYAIYYKRKFTLSEYILVDEEIGDKIKHKIGMKEKKYKGIL